MRTPWLRRGLIRVSALVSLVTLLLAGCTPPATTAPTQPAATQPPANTQAPANTEPAASGEPIVIAFSGPLTGPFADEGNLELWGFEMAIEDWNAKGGALGRPIEAFVCDDQVDVELGVACAQQAVERGAIAVVGWFFSNVAIAARPTVTDNGLIFAPGAVTAAEVMTTAEHPELGFRSLALASDMANATATYMLEELGLRQVFVLHDRDAWGRDQAVIVQEAFDAHPEAEALGFEGITVGESEFSGLVTTIMASGADSVYFGGHHIEQAAVINQLRDAGWEGVYVGPDSLKVGYPELAGDNATGSLFLEPAGPTLITEGKDWAARFQEKYGDEPRAYSASAYVEVDLILRGVEELGSTEDRAAIVNWIVSNSHDTILGNISYDENHEIRGFPIIVAEYRDGHWQNIATYNAVDNSFVPFSGN